MTDPLHQSRDEALARIARAMRRTELRVRIEAALDALARQAVIALIVAGAVLAVVKLVPAVRPTTGRVVLFGAALSIVLAGCAAAVRRLPPLLGAMLLDRHHGLAGRLANGLSFAALSADARTPLMEAAIDDACAFASNLSPKQAYRIRAPRDLAAVAGLGCLVVAIGLLEVRTHRVATSTVQPIRPALLDAEDVELFRDVGKQLADRSQDPALLAALAEYSQLVDDLAQRRLDRADAFRRLEQIETRMIEAAGLDAKALEEALKRRADALKKSGLAQPTAAALESQDLAKAERALRDLAQKLRDRPEAVQKGELERLREALRQASEGQRQRLAELQRLREEQRDLLKKRQEQGADAGAEQDEEKRLLQRGQRELERLERDLNNEQKAARSLDRLDRDLAQAAEDLMREAGVSSKDLEQGAEDINRLANEQASDKEREELLRRLQDLREQLRQGGSGDPSRVVQLRRFVRMARGQGAQGGGRRNGQQGEGQGQDQQGEGEQGQGQGEQGQGESGQGQGQGQGQAQTFVLQPGGKDLMLVPGAGLSMGQGSGSQGSSSGQQGNDPGGSGHDQGGRDWGTGHDPNLAGPNATNPKMGTMDVQAAGLDTGQGASRSEVIRGAGEKGFRGGAYKRVYTEYRTSAEERIHQDRVPPGANERIRRYFDLIRPRE